MNVDVKPYSVQPFITKENLQELGAMLRSAIGKKGTSKMFVTSAGQIIVSRLSSRLVSYLMKYISDPCAEAILYAMKAHLDQKLDFGLSLGSLCIDLTLKHCEYVNLEPIMNKFKLKIDTSSVHEVMAFIRSSVKDDIEEKYCVKLLEAFLQGFPDDVEDLKFHSLDVIVHPSGEKGPCVRKGYFYPCPDILDETDLRWKNLGKNVYNMIILNIQINSKM